MPRVIAALKALPVQLLDLLSGSVLCLVGGKIKTFGDEKVAPKPRLFSSG
jgi:hypothetical protein